MKFAAIEPASPEDTADGAEQRTAPRFTLLIRAAKIIAHQGEFVGVIRDVSNTGVSMRLFHRLPRSGALALELQSGEQFAIKRVWEEPGEAGFEFEQDVAVDRFISEVGEFPKRGLRFGIAFPLDVTSRGERFEAMVENISQQGARIACDGMFAIDQSLTLSGEGLDKVRAKVRWRSQGQYGVVFDDTFSLSQFAQLAAQLQAPALLSE
ncbi:PilZ domain-containing protein [Altererythrobacter lutimaris]|uniref:PilZ domain-containing protein n=1 Tax=Altererythrobacter lutimaris TaxID=2743979 RepID=A0A850HDT6_9SPHN|nr:PilZ domain-containing protein [Altererythrobacter lutimaris]NVE95281.1 PilZ domain-containing protein [Altererythrobacter lutimaris]